jgi:alpha-galactosidase
VCNKSRATVFSRLAVWAAAPIVASALSLSAQDTIIVPQKPEASSERGAGLMRTPAAARTPHLNGAGIFGVRPDHPFLYRIPATGDRPMMFSADGLPEGLTLDPHTGTITGGLWRTGEYEVVLHAKNLFGAGDKKFTIVVGETISLTPAMGWNSWNHYGARITQDIVLENARAMVASGLIDHGWSYINIDDGWQGARGGKFQGMQGNEKFPDLKGMCDQIHAMGLKFGLYSTPWTISYADYPGSTAATPDGVFTKPGPRTVKPRRNAPPYAIGRYHFTTNDAQQWAAWGVDYLKYDWNPIELPETVEMYQALRGSGRDIVFSLSNHMKLPNGPAIGKIANSWRVTGDILANWYRMAELGFGQDRWKPFSSPGHWIDADMLEIATAENGQPGLTPDEEYTHMTLWCLLCSPLLIANDLSHMDAFTKNLLTNDEVIAVNQDSLGDQAVTVNYEGDAKVYAKKLEDGSLAVGLFNIGAKPSITVLVRWSDLKIKGPHAVRDLWRQKDLGEFDSEFSLTVASHSAELVKIAP